jgi:hypothetical protein
MIDIKLGETKEILVNDLTDEDIQNFVANDQKIVSFKLSQGLSKENMTIKYNTGTPIDDGFIGSVELTELEAYGLVPDTFPNSSQAKMFDEIVYDEENETSYNVQSAHVDENDNVIMEQVNWIEYCGFIKNRVKTLAKSINGKLICGIGSRDNNGHGHIVLNAEFRMFADHFGIENILTKSETSIVDQRTAIKTFRGTISQELIDAMSHAELDALVVDIELMTGLDLVVSALNLEPKKEYIKEIIGVK